MSIRSPGPTDFGEGLGVAAAVVAPAGAVGELGVGAAYAVPLTAVATAAVVAAVNAARRKRATRRDPFAKTHPIRIVRPAAGLGRGPLTITVGAAEFP
ncbi:hypothetical protein GCM10023147_15750 [Tsukamurella soli]|uniref:Uncharacterized protein n=1 Tax=Tsukamurella soli TaxID=644556 RepID=A0ABP8JDV3_9ACTN